MEERDRLNQRYLMLTQLWVHHNLTQLQWPLVIVGFLLVGLSSLISSHTPDFAQAFRSDPTPVGRVLGIPLVIACIITMPMIRTMRRARQIMFNTAQEIDLIEAEFEVPESGRFCRLNTAPGISGPFLLAIFMLLLAAAADLFGFLLIVGWPWGTVACVPFLTWLVYELVCVLKTYRKRVIPAQNPKPGKIVESSSSDLTA